MEYSAPRGTQDITPDESGIWQYLEATVRETMARCGYGEIRTPIFEHTEVFERGVGTTTDIVEKEMYTFRDRGDRSITLRPEGTAPVIRAYVEHRMAARPQPAKMYYIGPMFRYERPQAGRFRQFHQFGMEVVGVPGPAADAEVIATPLEVFRALGIRDVVVNLNSIGCPVCRGAYREALRQVYQPVLAELCPSCQGRYDRNPLRLLDCKSEQCRASVPEPPPIFGYLCPECASHFAELRLLLDGLGIEYVINSRLVRGLDYYTRTTFEYNVGGIGSQDAIGGGGRYDGLVEQFGGQSVPGVGVACGMERCVLAMKAEADDSRFARGITVYLVSLGDAARAKAFELAFDLRAHGISADFDMIGRGLKAQMRYADKLSARYVAIIGDDELERGAVALKDMASGSQQDVPIAQLATQLLNNR
ncbi:MAG: Histidine--tRNA ligase [Firmicutes bacterium ADurb.Bin506]|jgi:histidyl-tRNA synthetase|nr:MAG: Histidine--tRNA ligase [Firmicutes bacterium ADurb.Bin506]